MVVFKGLEDGFLLLVDFEGLEAGSLLLVDFKGLEAGSIEEISSLVDDFDLTRLLTLFISISNECFLLLRRSFEALLVFFE